MHVRFNHWKGVTLVAALVWSGIPAGAGLAASTAKSTGSAAAQSRGKLLLQSGKTMLRQGKCEQACEVLQQAVGCLGNCSVTADAHLSLGQALAGKAKKEKPAAQKEADFISAKHELRTAIRMGKGTAVAKQANGFMVSQLPSELLSPRTGDGTEMIAAKLGLRLTDRGAGEAQKPKARLFEFYANWCEPCKELTPVISKIKQQYGDQIDIQAIDVDDSNNAELVDEYDIAPIPTVIYMNQDGQVVGYSIGYAGEQAIQRQLKKILPDKS